MANIFIFPCTDTQAQINFKHTIEKGYDVSGVLQYINSEDQQQKLLKAYPDGKCYLWGSQEKQGNNRSTWNTMSESDLVLGYRDKSIVSAAFVVTKIDSPELAEKVWGQYPDGPFRLIYFLTKPTLCEIRISSLSEYFGKEYHGFTKVRAEVVNKILNDYDSFKSFIQKRLLNPPPPPSDEIEKVISFINNQGFIFEPWQVAAYITALKTKPFVILAGVSGTGKSKLPALIAEATGGISKLIPVRPDWTDSSDILGYCDLPGKFRPGQLLEIIREAHENKNTHYVCIIDEMNLARVEHYLAEILSRIEDRREAPSGGFESRPILTQKLADKDKFWEEYVLPPNLAIVGTVNMDESAHGFSRKVLDRAFTIELSDIDLEKWESSKSQGAESIKWPVNKWYPLAIQPGKLKNPSEGDRIKIKEVIDALTEINGILVNAQLQVGYRTRDEIIMFVLHAQEFTSHFDSGNLKPLDLALQMKILPRIVGGSSPIRHVVLSLLGWAYNGQPFQSEEDAQSLLDEWIANGRAGSIKEAHYPHTSARLCLMLDRIKNEGFTSYWL